MVTRAGAKTNKEALVEIVTILSKKRTTVAKKANKKPYISEPVTRRMTRKLAAELQIKDISINFSVK